MGAFRPVPQDLNGDGLRDILVATGGDFRARPGAGTATVIFGKPGGDPVYTADIGSRGYRIRGAAAGDAVGFGADSAGDFNDDGRSDIVLSSPFSEQVTASDETWISGGAAYLVYDTAPPP